MLTSFRTQQLDRDGRTRWKWACFRSGSRTPYPNHYSRAFAFSTIPYPLARQVALRFPCLCAEAPGGRWGLPRSSDYRQRGSDPRCLSVQGLSLPELREQRRALYVDENNQAACLLAMA